LWHATGIRVQISFPEKTPPGCEQLRNNNIKTAYFQLQTKAKIPKDQRKPLKSIRKTLASLLEEHESYGRYAEYFLGEAPSSVASRHYVKPSKEQFDAAIRWLGKQFGIE
jgi:intergrase/recombinase